MSRIIILLLLLSSLSGCGVIFGGSKFNGTITVKDHPQADIVANGIKIGQGSATGKFKRSAPLVVEVTDQGCSTYTKTFNKSFRTGNFILSFVSWLGVGAIVDLATGAAYKPDHKNDPAIQQMSTDNFNFNVTYTGCPNK